MSMKEELKFINYYENKREQYKKIIVLLLGAFLKKEHEIEEFTNLLKSNKKLLNFIDIETTETLPAMKILEILEIEDEKQKERFFEFFEDIMNNKNKVSNKQLNTFFELFIG